LLDVAVGRAMRFGRGGRIDEYHDTIYPEAHGSSAVVRVRAYKGLEPVEVTVLTQELPDVGRVLRGLRLRELDSGLLNVLEAEGKDHETYRVNPELLPLELQMALKKVAGAIATAILNLRSTKWIEEPIGSLLTTCDPRAAKVYAYVRRGARRASYYIVYYCKSSAYGEPELWVSFQVDEGKLGKPDTISGMIWWA
jgi:hypothetical protein